MFTVNEVRTKETTPDEAEFGRFITYLCYLAGTEVSQMKPMNKSDLYVKVLSAYLKAVTVFCQDATDPAIHERLMRTTNKKDGEGSQWTGKKVWTKFKGGKAEVVNTIIPAYLVERASHTSGQDRGQVVEHTRKALWTKDEQERLLKLSDPLPADSTLATSVHRRSPHARPINESWFPNGWLIFQFHGTDAPNACPVLATFLEDKAHRSGDDQDDDQSATSSPLKKQCTTDLSRKSQRSKESVSCAETSQSRVQSSALEKMAEAGMHEIEQNERRITAAARAEKVAVLKFLYEVTTDAQEKQNFLDQLQQLVFP